MPYIRLTLAKPRPERRAEVRRHYDELMAHIRTLPGYLDGFVIEPHDESGEVGRISIWASAEDAHRAANDPHAMSLHAELHFDTQGSLWDRSFEGDQMLPHRGG